ncbi:protein enabled homolog [Canis lupus dingo]|uniref:protein enabled homolog n=1 Tax=Canis lupus dingo TaxID=286419 RepID=UPI0020C1D6CC|nr:protein enabled homolog [Canis lupus dingo]
MKMKLGHTRPDALSAKQAPASGRNTWSTVWVPKFWEAERKTKTKTNPGLWPRSREPSDPWTAINRPPLPEAWLPELLAPSHACLNCGRAAQYPQLTTLGPVSPFTVSPSPSQSGPACSRPLPPRARAPPPPAHPSRPFRGLGLGRPPEDCALGPGSLPRGPGLSEARAARGSPSARALERASSQLRLREPGRCGTSRAFPCGAGRPKGREALLRGPGLLPAPSGPARFSARLPRPSRVSLTPAGLPPALGLPRPQRQGSPEEGREGARDSLSARDFLVFLVLTTLDAQTQKTPRVPSPWPNLLNRSALVRDPPSLAVEPACISPVQLGRGFLSPVYTCSSCANANVPGVQPKGQAPTSFSGRGRCQLWLQAAGRSASPFVRAEASRPGICSLRALRNSKPCATCPPTSVPPKGNSTGHSP